MSESDHMRMSFENGFLTLLCQKYGYQYKLDLPCPIEFASAISNEFNRMHLECE